MYPLCGSLYLFIFNASIDIHFYFPSFLSLFLSDKSQKPEHSCPATLGFLLVPLKLSRGSCSCLPTSIAKPVLATLWPSWQVPKCAPFLPPCSMSYPNEINRPAASISVGFKILLLTRFRTPKRDLSFSSNKDA